MWREYFFIFVIYDAVNKKTYFFRADEEEIGLGAIPERDYPKTQNTMGYGLPRAVSMSHLTQPQVMNQEFRTII